MSFPPLAAAMEVLQPYLLQANAAQGLIAAKCVGLMRGYDAKWRDAPYQIDRVESVMTAAVRNPLTGRHSRSFSYGGKMDIHAREIPSGRRVIFDHKTTADEIEDPGGPYWQQLRVEGQVNHYLLLNWQNGQRVDYALWDVVRKPGILPKLLSKKEREAMLATGHYCGDRLNEYQLATLEETERETLTMYAARLAQDCIALRPERYFQRRTVPRLDAEMLEYATELWGNAQEILLARRAERWPRNGGACMNYGRPCLYLGICSGHDTTDSEKWTRKTWMHPELPIGETDGKELLTNSRLSVFQTCRRKHYYQYEMGLERVDEEEQEARWFGSLFHEASEQYFLALQKEQQQGGTWQH